MGFQVTGSVLALASGCAGELRSRLLDQLPEDERGSVLSEVSFLWEFKVLLAFKGYEEAPRSCPNSPPWNRMKGRSGLREKG